MEVTTVKDELASEDGCASADWETTETSSESAVAPTAQSFADGRLRVPIVLGEG
jgi:hypothetical protein